MRNYYINDYDCKVYTENEKRKQKWFIPEGRWFLIGEFKKRSEAYAEIFANSFDEYDYILKRRDGKAYAEASKYYL